MSALDYCKSIRNELVACETLLSSWDPNDFDDMADAFDELGFSKTLQPIEAVDTWLNETCLEVIVLKSDDGSRVRVEILRTCGGPRCEINRSSDDGEVIEITTYDGTDQATIRDQYPNLANYFDEIWGQ
jgi:hypothetical protein